MAVATTDPIRLPPGPRVPNIVSVVILTALKHRWVLVLGRRYGGTFTMNLPVFGNIVVISDPILIKDVFSTSSDLIERPTTLLGPVFGPGSTFSLTGKDHLMRRRLVLPAFHGRGVRSYEHIVEEEVMKETADWPEGREFETLETMSRLTLNSILRAMFGEDKDVLDELRSLLPAMVSLGSRLRMVPSVAGRDFGRWSPGGRLLRLRRRFDTVVKTLIAKARADPALEERSDMLAVLLQARYENGEPIPDQHIADELLTLVVAGHETTASQLAWIVERMRRHPELMSRLADEVDAGGSELRQATIFEVQRTRSIFEATTRSVKKRVRLGDWVLPPGTTVQIDFHLAHESEENFPDAASFNPDRFVGTSPKPFRWIPFGGGVNRCVGAGFAAMEMDVAVRTLLREFRFAPTDAPGERLQNRGFSIAPAQGARAVVYRRTAAASGNRVSMSVADHGS
ncbi:cytochrome P450 [Mycobacterium sp. NPDC048908]|uniref:cytochrome P450 n=1 Tax=Mycobacterium sp. NPDC048908 TaxID=3364292 RepID=UPI003716B6EF